MWCMTVLLVSSLLAIATAQEIKTSLVLNCAKESKPGSCLLKTVKVLEKDVIDSAARPSTEKVVVFEQSQLEYLPEVIFNKFQQMETLQASNVAMKKLSPNAFSKPASLKNVDISFNSVSALPQNVFGTCQNLADVNIARNRLHLFNAVELIGCEKLRSVNVSSNQLIFFNWDPLDDLRQLQVVDVSNNLVTVLSVPKYVRKIIARNNHIHELTADSNSFVFMLEQLDASRNRLSNIETLARFGKMTHIDLSYNRLVSVDFALFKDMRSLRELNLAHNNIFTVLTTELRLPITLSSVDLSNNELTQLSAEQSRGFSQAEKLLLNNNYLVKLEVTNGVNNFPRLKSVSLQRNDWACRDMEAMLKELKSKNVAVSSAMENCESYQVKKAGLCCRDLGASFDELVLLKSQKLAEMQGSTTNRPERVSTVQMVTQKSVSRVETTSTTLRSQQASQPPPSNHPTKAPQKTDSRQPSAEAQLQTLIAENLALKTSLEKAQKEVKTLADKLARCKSTVNQRTGQTVLID